MAKKLPPLHPGEILREEFLVPLGLSPGALAKAMGVPRTRVERIAAEFDRHHRRHRVAPEQGARDLGAALAQFAEPLRRQNGGARDRQATRQDRACDRRRRGLTGVKKILDSIPIGLYTHPVPPSRGRCHETSLQWGGMRRPRGGKRVPRTRAAPGHRPGALRPPARSSLTAVGSAGRVGVAARQAVEANWRQDTERHAKSLSRKRGPAPQGERRRGAPRGARVSQEARHERIPAALRGAPPPLFRGARHDRRPRRLDKEFGR